VTAEEMEAAVATEQEPATEPEPAEPATAQAAPVPDGADTGLEARLADAMERGDEVTCFELLLTTELVLLRTGAADTDPECPEPPLTEFATTTIDTRTCLMAFTSPDALTRALGARDGELHTATSARLAAEWPDPEWSLVVNAGLPSELRLDSSAVAGLDGMRRTAEQVSAVDAVVADGAPAGGATARVTVSGAAIRLPHGVQLWRYDGDSAAPVAVYDASNARWSAPAPA
jgi:type III secretion system (T3SS) SseB-like protein